MIIISFLVKISSMDVGYQKLKQVQHPGEKEKSHSLCVNLAVNEVIKT